MVIMCHADHTVRCAPTGERFRQELRAATIPYYCKVEEAGYTAGISKFNFVHSPGTA